MVEKIWFNHHLLGWLLWPLLWPLSLLYKSISVSKRNRFLANKSHSYRAPVPVVVVGNITAGGNGKTPMVIWLVETLKSLGYKPGVVSRGYGGKSEFYPVEVGDTTSVLQCGDEPKLIYTRTNVPVVVAPKRSDAVKKILEHGIDIVITDDGLQHYALDRDIELVVVDGSRRFGNACYIPLGPLREGLERLNSVDFVVCNGGEAKQGELAMQLSPDLAVNLVSGECKKVEELGSLVAFAGIGHPPRFFNTLSQLNANLIKTQAFADHQAFNLEALQALAKLGDSLIMTEKDAVKCRQFAQSNWWYLPVTATFSAQSQKQIVDKIEEVRSQYGSPSA